MRAVGLGYLLDRQGGLDAVEEWADSLSLGEQQRLGKRAAKTSILLSLTAGSMLGANEIRC